MKSLSIKTTEDRLRIQAIMDPHYADPNILKGICEYVSNGGTLATLAELWDVSYSDVLALVQSKDPKLEVYNKALDSQIVWGKEVILRELRAIGLTDLTEAFNPDGSIKPITEWPEQIRHSLAGVEVEEFKLGPNTNARTKKIKFIDRLRAIEMLGKHMGMFQAAPQIVGELSLEKILDQANALEAKDGLSTAG